MTSRAVILSGAFDDVRSHHLRLLQEAAKRGEVTVLLWQDELLQTLTGRAPKFPFAERLYFLQAVRYVHRVLPLTAPIDATTSFRMEGVNPWAWVEAESEASPAHAAFCRRHGWDYHVVRAADLSGFPEPPPMPSAPGRKKIVATGCFDWFHSGHVRFTEELNTYGDLYVIVGHDVNIRALKGEGHPLIPEAERRYVVGSIRFVKQALISSGNGWLDADPEIRRLKPDIYAVNEDGDKGGKREYCAQMGLEYLVLKRTPAPGLQRRSSTDLRGF